jgi:hypothetical protein
VSDVLLATCSYRAYVPAMGVPVITSLGVPRGFPPAERLGSLMPYWIFGNDAYDADPEAARKAYRHRLHQRSAHILDRLAELSEKYPDQLLVLLCWEADVTACHRGWAAQWLHDRHGIDVPEITAEG